MLLSSGLAHPDPTNFLNPIHSFQRQAGVTNAELADWADSPNRGYGRFSYLPGNTLVQAVSFIGAAQTASHVGGLVLKNDSARMDAWR